MSPEPPWPPATGVIRYDFGEDEGGEEEEEKKKRKEKVSWVNVYFLVWVCDWVFIIFVWVFRLGFCHFLVGFMIGLLIIFVRV